MHQNIYNSCPIDMKPLIAIFLAGMVLQSACHKKHCNLVRITKTGTPCSVWGIKSGSNIYPADSITDQFKQEGIEVCADFELFEDLRLCACCGGTWAKIHSLNLPD